MAKKSRPATEAGIETLHNSGRKKWPLYQWRQAIRTGLNTYWSGEGWLTIQFKNDDGNGGRRDVSFSFRHHEDFCHIVAGFTVLCSYGIECNESEVLEITSTRSDEVAIQLLRFSWNRDIKVLQVPVIKLEASFDIPDNKVVLAECQGELILCRGTVPILKS